MSEYKKYRDKHLLDKWDELISKDRQYILDLEQEWKEVKVWNEQVYKDKQAEYKQIYNELVALFKKIGIKYTNSRGDIAGWFNTNVLKYIRPSWSNTYYDIPTCSKREGEVNGVKLYVNWSPCYLVSLYDWLKQKYDYYVKCQDKHNQRTKEAIVKAAEIGLDISKIDLEQVYTHVNDYLAEQYRGTLKKGQQLYLDDNHCECEAYFYDDHRCSCGNRRIDVCIEGDFINGFYARCEPY